MPEESIRRRPFRSFTAMAFCFQPLRWWVILRQPATPAANQARQHHRRVSELRKSGEVEANIELHEDGHLGGGLVMKCHRLATVFSFAVSTTSLVSRF